MKREDAVSFINALVAIRSKAADSQAIECAALYPHWLEGKEYAAGERVRYEGVLYRVLIAHTAQGAWAPADAPSLFAKILIPDADSVPEWEQPGSTNPYMAGDKVTHSGKTWASTVDGNVWEPGVYGWEEI